MIDLLHDELPHGHVDECRAFVFCDGDLLLKDGALPSAAQAMTQLHLSASGPMGTLAPEGCIWGRIGDSEELPVGWAGIGRREFGETFGMDAFRAMSTAWGFAEWQRQAQFCGVCGARMVPAPGEQHAMRCTRCGHTLFPVICPAMIVAVERDGKLLLARNARHKTVRYTVLAGFLEAGESMEDAVVREVREEVGIEIDRDSIEYVSSQYWPFPSSLMLACRAKWKSGELHPDGVEIVDAGWYGPDDLPEGIPGTVTVAGQLIRDYLRRHQK